MSKLTQAARGRPCMIRLPNCDGGGDTTVLAHFRDLSIGAGIGLKPSDLCGAWACASCHDRIDGRRSAAYGSSRADMRLAHAMGVMRTLVALEREGKVEVRK